MESKKMMKKEVAFMKKKGAPKSMIKHEKAEAKGMNKGGKTSCYATGGAVKKMAMGGMAPPAGPMKRPMMGDMDSMQDMRAEMALILESPLTMASHGTFSTGRRLPSTKTLCGFKRKPSTARRMAKSVA
jgi:hypothetical protein